MENNKHIAIIGGGLAGIESATVLSKQGYKVTLIEKNNQTGGKMKDWSHLFPDFANPAELLQNISEKAAQSNVNIIYNTEIKSVQKQNGRFELSDLKDVKIYADAVVVAAGFKIFDASLKEEYGYGVFDNVITSADLESIFKQQKTITTKQGKSPKRIAIIHCVGSRDAKVGNTYCSKVCCITGIKQAIEINMSLPNCEVFCFYMDLRLYGSHFDSLYLEAQKQHNIQFIRGRLSEVSETHDTCLQIKAEDTLSGRPLRMKVDMVVLLVGMEPAIDKESIANYSNIQLDDNGFIKSTSLHQHRNCTTQRGIFAAGACLCPMSVSDTLENARSVVQEINEYFEKQ